MDYEEKYYDLLYENRRLKSKNEILEEELKLFHSNKNYMAISLTYVKRIKELTEQLDKYKYAKTEAKSEIQGN